MAKPKKSYTNILREGFASLTKHCFALPFIPKTKNE